MEVGVPQPVDYSDKGGFLKNLVEPIPCSQPIHTGFAGKMCPGSIYIETQSSQKIFAVRYCNAKGCI
jgi:hypothetical protein